MSMNKEVTPPDTLYQLATNVVKMYAPKRHDGRLSRKEVINLIPAILSAVIPKFDAMVPEQERLAIQFANEISGQKGKECHHPDPVRLLEMAQALYDAEWAHTTITKSGELTVSSDKKGPAPD